MNRRIAYLGALLLTAVVAAVALSPLAARMTFAGVCGLALIVIVRGLPGPRRRSAFEDALRPAPTGSAEPPELARLASMLTLAHARRLHAVAELTPILREIAGHRLDARCLSLNEEARDILGEDLWELVRPDLELPDDRSEPGPSIDALRRTLDALESL
jgi:hypothetical protein